MQDFIPKLKQHLLPRIRELLGFEKEASQPDDWLNVVFHRDRMFEHKIMRINFTSYDVRRGEDVIHPKTQQSNILMLNPQFLLATNDRQDRIAEAPTDTEDGHPFLYAKVIRIFHVNVIYIGEGNCDRHPRQLEFLWVQWYQLHEAGSWDSGKLDQLTLLSYKDQSFGFVDPNNVLRGCHIIPSYRCGRWHPSDSCTWESWKTYSVNR